jgi:hypothetical protein
MEGIFWAVYLASLRSFSVPRGVLMAVVVAVATIAASTNPAPAKTKNIYYFFPFSLWSHASF